MIAGAPQPWQLPPPNEKLVGSSQSPLLRRASKWAPALVLCFVCVCSVTCTLVLAILPMARIAAPLGSSFAPAVSASLPPYLGYVVLLVYATLWLMAVASAVTTARTPPGHVPQWLHSRDQGDKHYFHNVLQAVERKLDGSIRFCRKCGAFKPDRCHHSVELGQCVLCYEHWSLWANNAIGFYNNKMYLLALLYSAAANGLAAALLGAVGLLGEEHFERGAQQFLWRQPLLRGCREVYDDLAPWANALLIVLLQRKYGATLALLAAYLRRK